MRGTILMLFGLAVNAYTAFDRFHHSVYGNYKPLGFAIGCGLIMLGGWLRQRSKEN